MNTGLKLAGILVVLGLFWAVLSVGVIRVVAAEPRKTTTTETTIGDVIVDDDGYVALYCQVGFPGSPSRKNLPAAYLTYHLVFRSDSLEKKAKELIGRRASVDGKECRRDGKDYFLVELIVEDK